MCKAGDVEVEVPPTRADGSRQTPPPGDNGSSKPNTPKGSNVNELTSELKQLKLQRKIDKLKKNLRSKKCREMTSSSSSNEESDVSSEEEVKNKREGKEIRDPTTLLLSITIILTRFGTMGTRSTRLGEKDRRGLTMSWPTRLSNPRQEA
jgi:hypothetical protein